MAISKSYMVIETKDTVRELKQRVHINKTPCYASAVVIKRDVRLEEIMLADYHDFSLNVYTEYLKYADNIEAQQGFDPSERRFLIQIIHPEFRFFWPIILEQYGDTLIVVAGIYALMREIESSSIIPETVPALVVRNFTHRLPPHPFYTEKLPMNTFSLRFIQLKERAHGESRYFLPVH